MKARPYSVGRRSCLISERVSRVRWWSGMVTGVVLALAAAGCGEGTAHQGDNDGGLVTVDYGTALGFADARVAPADDSGHSRTDFVQGDGAPSDGGPEEDAATLSVCGDETCEDSEKDSCPQDCGTSCGEQRCWGEELCHDGTTCAVPISGTTIIYATSDEHDGNLGGRLGANTICRDDLPGDLSCGQPVALLSVSADDSVEALQGSLFAADKQLYAYDRKTNGLTLLADDWNHALNAFGGASPELHTTLIEGTGAHFGSWAGFWSGSQVDGTHQPKVSCGAGCTIDHTCNGWSTNVAMGSTNFYGTQGDARSTKKWLHSTSNYVGCSNKMRLLCACRRP